MDQQTQYKNSDHKSLEESIGVHFHELGFGSRVLVITPKSDNPIKNKQIGLFNFIKIKNLWTRTLSRT